MPLLSHIGRFFKDVGRDIQYRFEGAVLDFGDFARAVTGTRSETACDDVPDLLACKASFERMLAPYFHIAIRPQNQHATGVEVSSQEQEQGQTRRIRPVEILQQQDQRFYAGERL